jgi:hypothetical protein
VRSVLAVLFAFATLAVGLFFLVAKKPLRNLVAGIVLSTTGLLVSGAASGKLDLTIFRIDPLLNPRLQVGKERFVQLVKRMPRGQRTT